MKRTPQDFVEELVAEGRDSKYIKAVALSCRWQNCIDDVRRAYKKLMKRIKKLKSKK